MFEFEGSERGSEDAEGYFEARIVVDGADGFTQHNFPLDEGLYGTLALDVSVEDEIIYLVISAVPDKLTTLQTYPYEVRIGQQ